MAFMRIRNECISLEEEEEDMHVSERRGGGMGRERAGEGRGRRKGARKGAAKGGGGQRGGRERERERVECEGDGESKT